MKDGGLVQPPNSPSMVHIRITDVPATSGTPKERFLKRSLFYGVGNNSPLPTFGKKLNLDPAFLANIADVLSKTSAIALKMREKRGKYRKNNKKGIKGRYVEFLGIKATKVVASQRSTI